MILVLEVLIGLIIFVQTVVVPIVVLFRQPSGQAPKTAFWRGFFTNSGSSSQSKGFSISVQLGLMIASFVVFWNQGSFGFLLIGIQFLLVVFSRYFLKDYRHILGDERDFDLALRARSASLFVIVGLMMLYFIVFPATIDAFSLIAGFRLLQYLLELVFVYLVNAAQNRELETEEV